MAYNRPSWDDYFMDVVLSIAKRGTCERGRAGAVIAKDKKILSTGYVGSPAGLPHCDDVGHQIKKIIHEDGSIIYKHKNVPSVKSFSKFSDRSFANIRKVEVEVHSNFD